MNEADAPFNWHVRRFRTYRPPNRINRGLITAAPWLDALVLVFMFLALQSRFILQPGLSVSLPAAPFAGGSPYGHVVVVLHQESPGRDGAESIVFFDDERFVLGRPGQAERLRAAFAAARGRRPDAAMVIEADRRVSHGTLVDLVNAAAEAGIGEVNLATRPAGREAAR